MKVEHTLNRFLGTIWGGGFAVFIAVAAAGQVGLLLEVPGVIGSPFWPTSGVAIAALVIMGWRVLPFIGLGTIFVNGINFGLLPVTTMLFDSAGAMIEPVIAVAISRWLTTEMPFSFKTSKGIVVAWVACLIATAVATFLGIIGFALPDRPVLADSQLSALTWWVGNSAGALVIGPLLLAWARSSFSALAGRSLEAVTLLLVLPMVGGLAYGASLIAHDHNIVLLEALGVPAVLIAAYRFQIAGTVIAAMATTCSAIGMALVALSQGADPMIVNDSMLRLQFYVVVVTLGGHLLASEVSRRTATETELRAALARETEANNTKTIFLANMSHELRTPLNAILGFSEVIHTKALGDTPDARARYESYMLDIHFSGRHLLSLINDILDVSRIEAATYAVEKEELDASQLVEHCIGMVRVRADARRISLETHLTDGIPSLYADPRAARQIMINLLTNAVKFTPEGGKVTIAARTPVAGGLTFTVADTGIGIPAHALDTVFEPFRQARNHLHSSEYEGTGLGLAISKGLIELHGGTIAIDSTPGRGTIVEITFPPASGSERAPNPDRLIGLGDIMDPQNLHA